MIGDGRSKRQTLDGGEPPLRSAVRRDPRRLINRIQNSVTLNTARLETLVRCETCATRLELIPRTLCECCILFSMGRISRQSRMTLLQIQLAETLAQCFSLLLRRCVVELAVLHPG